MHNVAPALYVFKRMAGERTPGRRAKQKSVSGPDIDADGAIVQALQQGIEFSAQCLQRLRVDDDVGAQGATQFGICVGYRRAQEGLWSAGSSSTRPSAELNTSWSKKCRSAGAASSGTKTRCDKASALLSTSACG